MPDKKLFQTLSYETICKTWRKTFLKTNHGLPLRTRKYHNDELKEVLRFANLKLRFSF